MNMSSMRWTEEEYAAYVARRRETTPQPLRGSDGTTPQSGLRPASSPYTGEPEGTAGDTSSADFVGTFPSRGRLLEDDAKRTKYGNRRTEVDGKKFDSKHEAEVYQELMLRVRAGELRCVARQVAFDLPGGIRYIADFVTIGPDYRAEVIDAKSPATRKNRVYINKKKQMASEWGIEIREV